MQLDVRICFDSNPVLNSENNSFIVLWNSCENLNSNSFLSIPRFVEENALFLRESYLSWIYQLGTLEVRGRNVIERLKIRKNFSFWWMTLLNEKCNFEKSPQIDESIKLLAFILWSKSKNLRSVELETKNISLIKSFSQWCGENGIELRSSSTMPFSSRSVIVDLLTCFQFRLKALTWLLKRYFSRSGFRGVEVENWNKSKSKTTFVGYTDGLSKNDLKAGIFKSPYWTRLTDLCKNKKISTNWLHIWVPDDGMSTPAEGISAIKKLNQLNDGIQQHIFLDCFSSVKILFMTILDWLFLSWLSQSLSKKMGLVQCNGVRLWPLLQNDWKRSSIGSSAISGLYYLNLFEAALESQRKQECVFYLAENQDWEYALVNSYRQRGCGQIFGFVHSTIRFWDLRYFFDHRLHTGDHSIPLPDGVATNGPSAKNILLESQFPAKKIVEVEALRYLYLTQFKKRKSVKRSNDNLPKVILLCGDYSSLKSSKMLRMLERSIAVVNKQFEIRVRPHPNCPLQLNLYPELDAKITKSSLQSHFQKVDFVIVSSVSSTVLDAIFSGIPTIVIMDPNSMNLSPGRNMDGISFAWNHIELGKSLIGNSEIQNLNISASDYFCLHLELSGWKKLLKIKG